MRTRASTKSKSIGKRLVCPTCGNAYRFIEVMAEEAHLVDGNLNYIRLVEAVADHYVCCECDESIPAPTWTKPAELPIGETG